MSTKTAPKWYGNKWWVIGASIVLFVIYVVAALSIQIRPQTNAPSTNQHQADKKVTSQAASEKKETGIGVSAQQATEALYNVMLDYKFSRTTLSDGTPSLVSDTANPTVELLGDESNLLKISVVTLKTGNSKQEADGYRAIRAESGLFSKEIKDWVNGLIESRSGAYKEVKIVGNKTYTMESKGGGIPSLSFSANIN